MNRDIVLVMGLTGYGKSWWSKLFHRSYRRSIVYDPAASFPVKEWLHPEEIMDRLSSSDPPPTFDYGFYQQEEEYVSGVGCVAFNTGKMIYFIEECATVFDKGMTRSPKWVKNLTFLGRHQAASLVLIAQRPAYIPIDIRSQANRIVSFCQHEGADMDWLLPFYGKERLRAIPSLERFTCFDYHNGVVSTYSIEPLVKKAFGITLDKSLVMI